MSNCSLHQPRTSITKQASLTAAYWSMLGNGFSNDRGLEISRGSGEPGGITKV